MGRAQVALPWDMPPATRAVAEGDWDSQISTGNSGWGWKMYWETAEEEKQVRGGIEMHSKTAAPGGGCWQPPDVVAA